MMTVEVPIERLTPESFAPFGQIIGALPGHPAWERPRLTSWRMDFACDGPPDLKLIRYAYQPMKFTRLERHLNHTETRVPLMGGRFVMVVAPGSDRFEKIAIPDPSEVQAFLIDGTAGIMFWKGTWHSLDTYPAEPPHVDVAFISEKGTQAEIEVVGADPESARLTQVIDFAKNDIAFTVVDRHGLLAQGSLRQ